MKTQIPPVCHQIDLSKQVLDINGLKEFSINNFGIGIKMLKSKGGCIVSDGEMYQGSLLKNTKFEEMS